MKNSEGLTRRKLAAILFADIEGYTSMMQAGEGRAMAILSRYQEITLQNTSTHSGEIVKTYGDGSLILFNSTIDAVKCALAMQTAFSEEPVVPLRIGIHIGEVIRKENDVFGNGVNIAARIESMGVPGSILFSEDVCKKIKNQEDFTTVSLGQFEFKNVNEPMELFALNNEPLVVPRLDQMKGKGKSSTIVKGKWPMRALFVMAMVAVLSFGYYFYGSNRDNDVPRIAINTFTNEGNARDDYYARSFSSELTSELSGLQNLSIVPMNLLQNSNLNMLEIGNSLNLDFILSGTIRLTENGMVNIIPILINAKDGSQKWSKSFTKKSAKSVLIKSEITAQLLKVLQIEVTEDEKKLLNALPTENQLAYDTYLKGLDAIPPSHGSREDFEKAISLFRQATVLDSTFAKAWAYLGTAHRGMHLFGYDMRDSRLDSFMQYIEKAESIDPELYEVALAKARYKKYLYDYNGSRKLFSELLQKRPNDPKVLFENSFTWQREGFIKEALETKLEVRAMDPKNVEVQLETAWEALFFQDFDLAFECRDAALAIDPEAEWGFLAGAIIHWSRGQPGDLEKAGEILNNVPNTESSYPAWFWISQKLYEGDFESALYIIQNYPNSAIERQDGYYPKSLVIAIINDLMGKTKEAKKEYQASLIHMLDKIKENPDDFKYRNALSMAYAGLGNKKEAITQVEKAAELMPKDKDYLYGLYNLYEQMKIFAMLGEDDRALDNMAEMLSEPCPTHGLYFTREPLFARLQTNPRFQDLLEKSSKQKPKLKG